MSESSGKELKSRLQSSGASLRGFLSLKTASTEPKSPRTLLPLRAAKAGYHLSGSHWSSLGGAESGPPVFWTCSPCKDGQLWIGVEGVQGGHGITPWASLVVGWGKQGASLATTPACTSTPGLAPRDGTKRLAQVP